MFEDQDFKGSYIVGLDGFTYAELEEAYKDFISSDRKDDYVALEGLEKYGLTQVEALHILAYTGFSAKWINYRILDKTFNGDSNCLIFIENLDKALSKIEPARSMELFHMTGYLWDGIEVGAEISTPCYLSTSIEDFENSCVVLKIKAMALNSKARDVSTITNVKDEKEFIFLRNAKFRVIGINQGEKTTYVEMIEIP